MDTIQQEEGWYMKYHDALVLAARFAAVLALWLIVVYVTAVSPAHAGSCDPKVVNLKKEESVIIAAAVAAEKTGVDFDTIAQILMVESGFGQILGKPSGIVGGEIHKQLMPFLALVDMHHPEYDPWEICTSSAGAVGIPQVMPGTWPEYGGIHVHPADLMFTGGSKVTGHDVKVAQKILNYLYAKGAQQLDVDGILGPKTRKLLKRFQQESPWSSCTMRGLNRCTKVALLVAHAEVRYEYNPDDDRVALTLGVEGPSNPWDEKFAAIFTALFLLEHDFHKDQDLAIGAYVAGKGGWASDKAKKYVAKVRSASNRKRVDQVILRTLVKAGMHTPNIPMPTAMTVTE